MKNKKIAIVGGGISGLIVANELQKLNDVTIFEKARGVGGRMATRRHETFSFDHGTQYFTAKTPEFQNFCHQMQNEGIIDLWNCKFASISCTKIERISNFNEDIKHFVATPQMNSLCKHLSKGLNVIMEAKIEKISFTNNQWQIIDSNANQYQNFDILILAIPSHQAVELLPHNFKYYNEIAKIKMQGCFTLMLGFKEKIALEFDTAIVKDSILSWVSVNNSKPQRNESFALTVHSSNEWAEQNMEINQEIIKNQMLDEAKKIIHFEESQLECCVLHRWRFANAPKYNGEKSYFDTNLNIGICGDYLISGRIESAFLSGKSLLDKIISTN